MEENDQNLYDQFDRLIARHGELINRLCMRRAGGNADRCAELRQDCYISLWHYLPKLRKDANVVDQGMRPDGTLYNVTRKIAITFRPFFPRFFLLFEAIIEKILLKIHNNALFL